MGRGGEDDAMGLGGHASARRGCRKLAGIRTNSSDTGCLRGRYVADVKEGVRLCE